MDLGCALCFVFVVYSHAVFRKLSIGLHAPASPALTSARSQISKFNRNPNSKSKITIPHQLTETVYTGTSKAAMPHKRTPHHNQHSMVHSLGPKRKRSTEVQSHVQSGSSRSLELYHTTSDPSLCAQCCKHTRARQAVCTHSPCTHTTAVASATCSASAPRILLRRSRTL